ncbi:MAG TPA: hypothetical protein VGH28_04635 [Polyangiaceae bacterium]|jgi:hypothetical protein
MTRRSRIAAAIFFAALATTPLRAHAADEAQSAEDDPDLAQHRERFKQGLDRYEANDVAGALSYWEPLYRDLGPARGYRVGYNLARAYEVVGDLSRAAERYASFLDEVKQRRAAGKSLDDLVAADESKASARLEAITRARGRIHVAPTALPESVRVDQTEPRLAGFVAYVAPGGHDVVFAPGSPREHAMHVTVRAGEMVEVALPAPPPDSTKPIVYREQLHHPLSLSWIVAFGAATLVGGGLTGYAYGNALVLHDRYSGQPTTTAQNQKDYDTARTLAYVSWALPAALAVATLSLVLWYTSGTKHTKIPVIGAISF